MDGELDIVRTHARLTTHALQRSHGEAANCSYAVRGSLIFKYPVDPVCSEIRPLEPPPVPLAAESGAVLACPRSSRL